MGEGRKSSSSTELLWAMGCAWALSTGAWASESGDRCHRNMSCRVHSEKGVTLSEQKNYAAALNEFLAAYDAEPAPRLLLNIGRSLYRLERPQEALDYYARYRKAVTALDVEAERVVKRYELDAQLALAVELPEPKPAALQAAPDPWPPRAALGLVGAGVGLLVIGIGLGAGAIMAGNEISQSSNHFLVFNGDFQAIERRGINLQSSGIAFDVFGLMALGIGAASLGTWLALKKSAPRVAKVPGTSYSLSARHNAAGHGGWSFGGR